MRLTIGDKIPFRKILRGKSLIFRRRKVRLIGRPLFYFKFFVEMGRGIHNGARRLWLMTMDVLYREHAVPCALKIHQKTNGIGSEEEISDFCYNSFAQYPTHV